MKTIVKRSTPRFNPLPTILDELLSQEGFQTKAKNAFKPAVNILEDDKAFTLEFALPGVTKEAITIKVENDLLHVSSKASNSEEKEPLTYSKREFNYSNSSRSFTFPEIVDITKIDAESKDGILYVRLPKNEALLEKKVQNIQIK